jgi:hypothetical protein
MAFLWREINEPHWGLYYEDLHRTIIQKYNPLIILIDLTTEATAGKMDRQ